MQDNIRRPLVAQRTYQPKSAVVCRHGFMHRNSTKNGRAVLKRRMLKGQVAARRLSGLRAVHAQAGKQMRKELRLRRRKDFDAVFRKGRGLHNELLVLRTVPNELDHNRYGFITSKRLGKAVVRNRVRRRLKEAVRVLPATPGWDVVVSAKTRAAEADFHALNRAVIELLGRAGILDEKAGEQPA